MYVPDVRQEAILATAPVEITGHDDQEFQAFVIVIPE
jgi:hypothetical protein